jgi:hypothetical protein
VTGDDGRVYPPGVRLTVDPGPEATEAFSQVDQRIRAMVRERSSLHHVTEDPIWCLRNRRRPAGVPEEWWRHALAAWERLPWERQAILMAMPAALTDWFASLRNPYELMADA